MSGSVLRVSTSVELEQALSQAKDGQTIVLAAGDYGELRLDSARSGSGSYDADITIKSESAESKASFSGLFLSGVSNLTFESIDFDYTFDAEDPLWHRPFEISASSNIEIKSSHFNGDVASGTGTYADGYGTGFGLVMFDNVGVVIEDTEFSHWWKAMSINRSADVDIVNNEIHQIRSDGLNIVDTVGIAVEGNYIHDFNFHPDSPDHADMIQIMSTDQSEKTTSNLIIRDNILDIGDGSVTQMIFAANGKHNITKDDADLYHNILIEDNFIRGGHVHGISVGTTDGLVIQNNTLLAAEGVPTGHAPRIRADDTENVIIRDNASSGIVVPDEPGAMNTWTVSNNLILQDEDPNATGFYENQFFASTTDGRLGDFLVDPDSELAQLDAGTTWNSLGASSPDQAAIFDISFSGDNSHALVFDARASLGPNGALETTNAVFKWDFGDGTSDTGVVVKHVFQTPGEFDVTLTVEMPDGTSISADALAQVAGGRELTFNQTSGAFEHHAYGETTTASQITGKALTSFDGRKAIDLGGPGAAVEVSADHFSRFLGSEGFALALTFVADVSANNFGDILRIPNVLDMSVGKTSGLLNVRVFDEAGNAVSLQSNAPVTRGFEHDISVVLDVRTETLKLTVDGVEVDQSPFESAVSSGVNHKLFIGNPWSGQNVEGKLLEFNLESVAADYATFSDGLQALSSTSETGSTSGGAVAPASESGSTEGHQDGQLSEPFEETGEATAVAGFQASHVDEPEDSAEPLQAKVPETPEFDGFRLDLTDLDGSGVRLVGDTYVQAVTDDEPAGLVLDGTKDYVHLGRMEEFEASTQISVDLEFQRADPDGHDILFWNHGRLGITMYQDTLELRVGQEEAAFYNGWRIENAGIQNTDVHSLRLSVDSVDDHLQLFLNDELILKDTSRDLDLVQAGTAQHGYMIGTPWNSTFEGMVFGVSVDDSAEFLSSTAEDTAFWL